MFEFKSLIDTKSFKNLNCLKHLKIIQWYSRNIERKEILNLIKMVYILLWRTWNCSYTLETENSRAIQDYSAGNKQSMSDLGMMLQRKYCTWFCSEQTLQSVLYWCLPDASPSRVFNFLMMSFNVSCLCPPSLFCLFNNSLFLFLSSLCRPQRAQLSSNQYNWVTLQLEWTLGLSS